MTTNDTGLDYVRSPDLLQAQESVVVVVDVQEKLVPHIFNRQSLEQNVGRIVHGATIAKVPIVCTEQYPQGLGPTVSSIADLLSKPRIEKLTFSCAGSNTFRKSLAETGRRRVLLCGMETHVCVLQTALDLLAAGYQVFLCADAVGSRSEEDHQFAWRRMEANGVSIATVESCLFEWCEAAGTESFREIRKLVV